MNRVVSYRRRFHLLVSYNLPVVNEEKCSPTPYMNIYISFTSLDQCRHSHYHDDGSSMAFERMEVPIGTS